MSDLPAAFFVPHGHNLAPTALCIGPWSAHLQHGGPPSALLTRAIRASLPEGFHLSRLTFDLMRPLRLEALRAEVTPTRVGRAAAWFEARLLDAEGAICARATASAIRASPVDLPPGPLLAPPPSAEGVPSFDFPFFPAEIAYHRAVDVRLVRGRWPEEPCAAWMRLRVPLVEGEPTHPVDALITLADACNGLAPAVADLRTSFVNADLSVHLLRAPVGDTFGFDARSVADTSGMGLVQAAIFDEAGELGRCAQSLVVSRR